MIVKGEIATREDMNGEFSPTPNTDLLINFKQIPVDYTEESATIAEERTSFSAEGYPRSFLDGINQSNITLQNDLNSTTGFTVSGLFQSKNQSDLLEDTIKCGYLDLGVITSTANIPSDGGSDRTISLFFKPVSTDLTGTSSIFTQRISSNRGYHIGILDGRLYSRAYDSSGNYVFNTYITNENLVAGTWYNIIISHDGTNFKAFLNGILRKDFAISGTPDYVRPYQLGNMLGGSYRFKGYIRSLCILNYDVTNTEAIAFQTTYKNNFRAIPYNSFINTSGSWAYSYDTTKGYNNDYVITSNTANDTFELGFYGNKVELYCREYPSAGTANIYIDDAFIEQIDTYNLVDSVQNVGTYTQDTKADHTIKIEVVSGYIAIDYFKIYDVNFIVGVHGNQLFLDSYLDALIKEYSYPTGYPRYDIDDTDERGRFFYRNLDGEDDDIVMVEGASIKETSLLFDRPTKVLDLSGGYAYTNNVPTSDGGTQRAFGCLFKPSSSDINGAYSSIATQRVSTNRGYHIGLNPVDTIYIRMYDSAGSPILNYDPSTSALDFEANKWYWVVLTHDASNWEIYVNGVILVSGTFSGTPDYTTNYWKIGAFGSSNTTRFYGQVSSLFLDSMDTDYWLPATMLDKYETLFTTYRFLPSMCSQSYEGNVTYEQNTEYIKSLTLNDLNDTFIFTFTLETLSIFGYEHDTGGTFDYYIDDVYIDTVQTYNASETYEEFIYLEFDGNETHTLKIVNTNGNPIWFTDCTIYQGQNTLYDESGKENNCIIHNLVAISDKEFRDNIVSSKYEFGFKTEKADYAWLTHFEIPDSIFDNIGDKWFMGGVIKPISHSATDGFLLFNNTSGSDNTFFRLGHYTDHVTAMTDYIRLYGDFINETIDLGVILDDTKYYFFGVLVDDDEDETWYIVFNITDQEVLISGTVAFTVSTTYPRDTFNTAYINYPLNTDFGTDILDSFIFEGTTEHTTSTILEMLYSLSYATGADQESPSDVLSVYSSTPKLELRKDSLNKYLDYGEGYYFSKVLNTGVLEGTGKLNMSKDVPQGTVISKAYTRTSEDIITSSPVWSSWEEVSDIGIIQSPNRQYMQVSFVMFSNTDRTLSPTVTNIQVLDVDPVPYARKAFSYPITYGLDGKKEAIIHDCTNLHQIQELNGADFIQFDLPYDSTKREFITPEKYIRLFEDYYITRNIKIVKNDGKTFVRVYGEAIFYNLQKAIPLLEKDFLSSTPSTIIEYILEGTGWELLESDITITRDFSIDGQSNQLEQLRRVQELFGGDLIFNNQKKQVSLLENSTIDNGVIFAYKKNQENIEKEIDSSDLSNRIYVYGEDGLNISSVNDGKSYVTNDISSYVTSDTIFCKELSIPDISSSDELLQYANYIKPEYATPKLFYSLTAKDFSVLENLDLSYNVGDTITVFDEELDIEIKARIVAVDYNILVPNESTITLSNKTKNLGDEITEFKKHQQRLDKLNWITFMRMIRFYLQNRVRGIGWVSADYVKVSGTPAFGVTGVVDLNNPRSYLNVRAGSSLSESIIGSKNHGDSIIILDVSSDGDWYKINI